MLVQRQAGMTWASSWEAPGREAAHNRSMMPRKGLGQGCGGGGVRVDTRGAAGYASLDRARASGALGAIESSARPPSDLGAVGVAQYLWFSLSCTLQPSIYKVVLLWTLSVRTWLADSVLGFRAPGGRRRHNGSSAPVHHTRIWS